MMEGNVTSRGVLQKKKKKKRERTDIGSYGIESIASPENRHTSAD